MGLFLLIVAVVCSVFQSCVTKYHGERVKGAPITYAAIQAFFALLFFVAINRNYQFPPLVVVFSAAFGVAWSAALLFAVLALRVGSMARTSLVSSFSLLIPTLFGIIFYREPVTVKLIIGAVLLAVSLFLTHYQKSGERIRRDWLVFVAVAFVTNGSCSVIQRLEQTTCEDQRYSSVFMVMALALAAVILFAAAFIREGKSEVRRTLRCSWLYGALGGLAIAALNQLVIRLNSLLPASILFTSIAGGGLALNVIVSCLLFRERFSRRQWIGFAAGVAAVVLFNL